MLMKGIWQEHSVARTEAAAQRGATEVSSLSKGLSPFYEVMEFLDEGLRMTEQSLSFSGHSIERLVASAMRGKGQITDLVRALDKKISHALAGGDKSSFKGVVKSNESLGDLIRTILRNPTKISMGNKTMEVYNAARDKI